MNKHKGSLFEAIVLILTEQLLLFPLTLSLLYCNGAESIPLLYCLFASAGLSGSIIIHFAPRKWHVWLLIGDSALMAGFVYALEGLSLPALITVIISLFVLYRSVSVYQKRMRGMVFYPIVFIGVLSYCICALAYNHYPNLNPLMLPLGLCATMALIGACVCVNLTHINYERRVVNKVTNVPPLTTKSNRTLLILFIGAVLVLSSLWFIDYIWAFILMVGSGILNGFKAFANWVWSIVTYIPERELELEDMLLTPAGDDLVDTVAASGPNLMQAVMHYAGLVILVVVIGFSLFFLIRKFKHLFVALGRWLVQFFKNFMNGYGGIEKVKDDYEDEMESLLKEGETLFSATRKWLAGKAREEKPYILLKTNGERARWLYRHLVIRELKRGLALQDTMTSGEALYLINNNRRETQPDACEKPLDAYHEARYSKGGDPSDEKLEAMKRFYSSKSPRV